MLSLFFAPKDDPAIIANGPYYPFSFGHILIIFISFLTVYLLLKNISQKEKRLRYIWVYWAYAVFVIINLTR